MMGVLDVDSQLLQREHRLAAHVRAGVERRQVEVAAFVEHLRRARVLEQEVLELGTDVERVEAHRLRTLQRAAQHVARVALVRGPLGRDHVAEHPPHALLLRAPRQHRERARVGHRDHVRLLDRVEARDRGPVEAHAGLERVVQLGGVDRERLQLPEDVGEPEADEADLALRDDRLHVLRRLRQLGHPAAPYRWPAIAGMDGWPNRSPDGGAGQSPDGGLSGTAGGAVCSPDGGGRLLRTADGRSALDQ